MKRAAGYCSLKPSKLVTLGRSTGHPGVFFGVASSGLVDGITKRHARLPSLHTTAPRRRISVLEHTACLTLTNSCGDPFLVMQSYT